MAGRLAKGLMVPSPNAFKSIVYLCVCLFLSPTPSAEPSAGYFSPTPTSNMQVLHLDLDWCNVQAEGGPVGRHSLEVSKTSFYWI